MGQYDVIATGMTVVPILKCLDIVLVIAATIVVTSITVVVITVVIVVAVVVVAMVVVITIAAIAAIVIAVTFNARSNRSSGRVILKPVRPNS